MPPVELEEDICEDVGDEGVIELFVEFDTRVATLDVSEATPCILVAEEGVVSDVVAATWV